MENIRDGLCGRMCREQCQAQKDRILGQSLKKSAKSKMKPYIFLCLRRNGQQPEKLWEMIIPVAYRILDAQYFGVPQRRRRIFLVADFAGECAGKVLFESESVFGNFKKSLCSWQGTAGTAETGIGETGTICLNDQGGERIDVTQDKTTTLRAQAHHPPCVMFENHSQDTRYIGPLEVSQTVLATFRNGR